VAISRQETARARTGRTLAEEILAQDSEGISAIASEHELCRRFKISRVTVRLALGDLEARGLIFRRHGKGTFAFGRAKRVRRPLGILLKTLPDQRQWPISELIRGFQFGAAAAHLNVLLLHESPQEWTSEVVKDLGGVFVIPAGLARQDVEILQYLKLPVLLAWESNLPGSHIDFGQVLSARTVAERLLISGHERIAFLGGFEASLDELKKAGILEALESVGKGPEELVEFMIPMDDGSTEKLFTELTRRKPGITAVIAADDGIAAAFARFVSSQTEIQVPENISVASFHGSPFPFWTQKSLSTVNFDFFEAGRMAAESLALASMTGEAPTNLLLPGTLVDGATIGCRSVQPCQEAASSSI